MQSGGPLEETQENLIFNDVNFEIWLTRKMKSNWLRLSQVPVYFILPVDKV